jgi:hypothetical protein
VAQQQIPNLKTCEVLAKTFSNSIPSVRLMVPADPSGVPGLGLDTVFLDIHTSDLAQLFLPVPGTLEAVVARQELPLLLDVAELPGMEGNFVVLRLAVVLDGGVIKTVGGKKGGSEDRLCSTEDGGQTCR